MHRTIRPLPTVLDLVISPESEVLARDLAERETGYRSYFRFEFGSRKDGLVMRIGVPDNHVDVPDAIESPITRTGSVTAVNDHV
ncbi:MAG TPA: hypothetical protein VGO30_06220 [Mycobacterium sp.]|nr:hypothetical protein [Mycobacterium sp.]